MSLFNSGERSGNLLFLNDVKISHFLYVKFTRSKENHFLFNVLLHLLSVTHIACDFKYFQQLAVTSQKHIKMTLGEDLKDYL